MRIVHSPENAPAKSMYALLTASITPRPIAWVSTASSDGTPNLAPYSFFTIACTDPAILSVTSIGHKDTWRNVEATGEFVVNIGTESLMEVMNATSAPFSAESNEFAEVWASPLRHPTWWPHRAWPKHQSRSNAYVTTSSISEPARCCSAGW